MIDAATLRSRRSLNVAVLGLLSRRLAIDLPYWQEAIRRNFKPELHEMNLAAFDPRPRRPRHPLPNP